MSRLPAKEAPKKTLDPRPDALKPLDPKPQSKFKLGPRPSLLHGAISHPGLDVGRRSERVPLRVLQGFIIGSLFRVLQGSRIGFLSGKSKIVCSGFVQMVAASGCKRGV